MSKADATVDDTPVVTEEQVKEANKAEEAKWQGDFKEEDLKIPYKREENEENKEDKKADKEEEPTDAEEGKDTDVEEEELETYSEPESAVTVEDPGEYKPADYSFQVTVFDEEGENPKTKTVNSVEQWESLLDDNPNFGSAAALLKAQRLATNMERKLETDKSKYDEQKEQFEAQTAEDKERQETVEGYASEFQYLVSKGLLPEVPKEYQYANWEDPEVAKQPGVKEQVELLNYMIKENKVRAKAGVRPLTSIVDTFNAWQLDTGRKAKEAENKAAGEARKAASSRVAGVSPSQQGSYVPKGIAVGNPGVFRRGAATWDD